MPKYSFSLASSVDVTIYTDAENAGTKTRSGATADKPETGILIFVTSQYSMAVGYM